MSDKIRACPVFRCEWCKNADVEENGIKYCSETGSPIFIGDGFAEDCPLPLMSAETLKEFFDNKKRREE
jgi:hypothetical protein